MWRRFKGAKTMKTNYYIGIPVKKDEKRCYFLCTDTFIGDYFLEPDKFHAVVFSSEDSVRDWIKKNFPFTDNRENNPIWSCLSKAEKENFDWDKYYILKETWEVIES